MARIVAACGAPLAPPRSIDGTGARVGTPQQRVPRSISLRTALAWMDQQLGAKPCLKGDQFTVADAYLFTVAGWGA
jgi:glutathione S-transferase